MCKGRHGELPLQRLCAWNKKGIFFIHYYPDMFSGRLFYRYFYPVDHQPSLLRLCGEILSIALIPDLFVPAGQFKNGPCRVSHGIACVDPEPQAWTL